MSVTTPSTGQKISDFSAGNVDANSYFIQANSGSTSKVSASQIGQFSNLNLLFNGEGGLDTTNKTIVGAINEIKAKEASDIADVQAAIDELDEKTGSDIAVSSSSSETIAEALSALFLINTYTATVTVGANGVTALKGQDMGYNSIPSGYTPIVYSFSCVNSNDLFFNLSSLTATGSQQFGVIRNISANAQNDKNCTVKITFIKSAFL